MANTKSSKNTVVKLNSAQSEALSREFCGSTLSQFIDLGLISGTGFIKAVEASLALHKSLADRVLSTNDISASEDAIGELLYLAVSEARESDLCAIFHDEISVDHDVIDVASRFTSYLNSWAEMSQAA